jgi:methyl-accepting chemotaxis protein
MGQIKSTWISTLSGKFSWNKQAREIASLQKELAETKQELSIRSDIMNLTSIVSYADIKGDIIQVNDKYSEVSQYSKDELLGQPHSITRHPDMAKSIFKEVWSTIKRGKTFRGLIKNKAKDGSPYYVDAVIAPFIGENGRPTKYLGVRYDVTEQEIERQNAKGILSAIDESYAYVEFDLSGNVLTANENFLGLMQYKREEIIGKHHKIFVEASQSNLASYATFWEQLNSGKAQNDVYKRITKTGAEKWVQAVYAPVIDEMGRVLKIINIVTDITSTRLKAADNEGQIEAIGKSQAVIEFTMDAMVTKANDNFLSTLGYSMQDIKGKHHSMFVEDEYRSSQEYAEFWKKLANGEPVTGEFLRIAKNGSEIWIQASYNPILDLNGKPFKVVEYSTDITSRKRAVNEIKRILLRLAKGDLTTKIEDPFKGEFVELGDAISAFIQDLNSTISDINLAVDTITNASSEISQGNNDLSTRTEQQAASLEETASSMEELTSTVRLNAENANQANGLASDASKIAVDGGALIQNVVETMSSINESAQKISDIIGVIDGIAFQTNILALNAAVEAARAGEQGRGFAVVASEVRTLAQRSATAAKDIKSLISDSVSKIDNGNTLVNQSGETMKNVVASIQQVDDIVTEIAAASTEQASGIDEVGKAITQMDEVTQQNAALVEEAAAAAESLKSQAQQLSKRVSTFVLDEPNVLR